MKRFRRSFLVLCLLAGAAVFAGIFVPVGLAQPAPSGAVYVITHVDVTPANNGIAVTNKLLLNLAAASKNDKGLIRFEVLVQDGRPNHFTVVEVWQSRAAFEAHGEMAHTRQFREKIQPFLGSPFDERLHALMQ